MATRSPGGVLPHSAGTEAFGDTRCAILNSAERVFGLHGFDGASMREIAQGAAISQSLLHYHFQNKLTLYEAAFERRATVIRESRAARLQDAFAASGPVTLEGILEILFMPLGDLLNEPRDGLRHYLQMLAEVTLSTSDRSIAIVRRFYDPSAEQFIEAFCKVVPNMSRSDAVWAYLFAIGARMQAHSSSGRAVRLGMSQDSRSPYKLLVPFVAAGIRTISL